MIRPIFHGKECGSGVSMAILPVKVALLVMDDTVMPEGEKHWEGQK